LKISASEQYNDASFKRGTVVACRLRLRIFFPIYLQDLISHLCIFINLT